MTVENIYESMGPAWDRIRDPWICSQDCFYQANSSDPHEIPPIVSRTKG